MMVDDWYIFISIFSILLIILLVKFGKRTFNHELRARDVTKGHYWCYTGMFVQPSYCNICETLIITSDGAFCGACGVCSDQPECIAIANATLPCKSISVDNNILKHHWIKGNLSLGAICEVCEDECGTDIGLSDLQCCWCHRTCHTKCCANLSDICDLGPYQEYVVPPTHIKLKTARIRKQRLIKSVTAVENRKWNPIIVIGNISSGSSEAEHILASFSRVLNPSQVIDLGHRTPQEALEWCHLLPASTACRVVVAGGDGTVHWILNTIHKMKLQNKPHLSIVPLGTGNDLSRVLGWGEGHSGPIDVLQYLSKMVEAVPSDIDSWRVSFTPNRQIAGLRMPSREVLMNNYLSLGVDALVTLNFHRARESPFYFFKNRTLNKFIYFTYGTKDVLMQECKDLHQRLQLFLDGQLVVLPPLEALVVLNIPCWGAGVRPWEMGTGGFTAPKQSISDGLLEVFCLSSSFHIAQLQCGLTEPIRIGQGKAVKLILSGICPMQVDGEPWQQPPGEINIVLSHKAQILINNQEEDE